MDFYDHYGCICIEVSNGDNKHFTDNLQCFNHFPGDNTLTPTQPPNYSPTTLITTFTSPIEGCPHLIIIIAVVPLNCIRFGVIMIINLVNIYTHTYLKVHNMEEAWSMLWKKYKPTQDHSSRKILNVTA